MWFMSISIPISLPTSPLHFFDLLLRIADQPKVKRQKVSSTVNTIKELCSSTIVKKFRSLRLRNPPKPFYSALKCLSILQKKKVIDMGFGSFLEFSCAGIPAKLGHFVVDKFHAKSMKLKLENGDIKITPELIHHICGIPCGGISVESLVAKNKNKECYVNWRSQFVKELRPNDILRRIEETEADDMIFVLNFIILFLNSMVECIPSGKCKTDVLERIDEDVDFKSVDWCGYIYECLKKCKGGWNRDDIRSYFTGPVTFLILIYLEVTRFKQLDTPINVPSIKFWSVEMMKKREVLEIESGGFGRCEIKNLSEKRVAQEECNLELIYLEGTTFKHLDTPINVSAIKFWSVEMMKKREILEIESGGFGRFEIKRLPEKIAAQEESELEIIRISEDINSKLASFLEAKTELEILFSSAFRKFPDNQILTKKKNIFHSILVKNAFKDDPPEASPSSENADQRDFDNAEQEHVKEEASVVNQED
ncbi:hypothetical protein R6Q57_016380 [Mikania cordata]